ncbi:MAG: PEP-CTERM system TPR-repeat protein PrsT [Burkholderiales bacterium]|nr:PEP-CTERM system TPR-repeat protein PrsT [Burkholderiales bacterium]
MGSLAAAEAAIQKADHRTAIIHLKVQLQKDASDSRARYLLGKSLLALGDLPGARIELQKAKESGYSADEVWPALGVAMTMSGDARRFIQEAANLEPTQPKDRAALLAVVAVAHGTLGQVGQAKQAAEEALRAQLGNHEANLALVRVAMAERKLPEARERLDKVLKDANPSVAALLLNVDLLVAERASDSARMDALKAVLKAENDNIQALGAMALMQASAKEFEAAESWLARMQNAHPRHPSTRYHRGLLALMQGNLEVAAAEAEQLLKTFPDSPPFRYLAGTVAFQRGSLLQAAAHLSKVAAQPDAQPGVRKLLARTFLRQGDPSRALVAVRPLIEGGSNDSEALGIAAEAHLQQGDMRAANALFERAIRLNPRDVAAQTSLAWAQMQGGDTALGLSALQRVSATDQGVVADLAMVSAHVTMRRLPEAMAALDVVERKMPGQPFVATLRGRVELMRGNVPLARKHFEAAQAIDPYHLPAVNALAVLDVAGGERKSAEARYQALITPARSSLEAELALLGLKVEEGLPYDQLLALAQATQKRFPEDPQARLAVIRVHSHGGRHKEAVLASQEGAAAFPGEPAFLDALAHAHFKLGEHSLALQAASKLASLQPGSPVPFLRMAEMARSRRDVTEALDHLRRAVSLRPDYLPAQQMMVELYAMSKKMPAARAVVASIQKQRPTEPEGWMLDGDLNLVENKIPSALEAYRAALQRGGASQVALKYHAALTHAGQLQERLRFEDQWLNDHPSDNLLRMTVADAAMMGGQYERARTHLAHVLKLSPDHAHALNNMAWVAQQLGQLPEALRFAERAAKLAPKSAPVLDTLASVLAASGQLNRAIEKQRQALAEAPGVHVHRLHLAKYLVQAGEKSDARKQLEVLQGLGEKFAQHEEVRAMLGTL